ncbi:MAG TPA: ABC transporter permease [Vicinamibacteria bacterium]|nr:ABC transporter permease [Vicinamibacteria bacterium]
MVLRNSLRLWVKESTFVVVTVVILAFGIGAVTSVFSVVESVVLRPLPFDEPSRLVIVWETESDDLEANVSGANLLDWQSQSQIFEGLAAFAPTILTRTGIERTERLPGVEVTANFFPVLGVDTHLGRAFSEHSDDAKAVVLAHDYWERSFASDPSVVGESIVLNGSPYVVIGVAARDFEFSFEEADVWTRAPDRIPRPPVDFGVAPEELRGLHWLRVIGRLREDVELASAQAEMDLIASRLAQAHPDDNAGRGVNLVPLHEQIVGDVRRPLAILLAAVGSVLLVICANLAGLFLSRAVRRERDVAIRSALGASRNRILAEHLAESLSLGLAGGALGVGISFALTRLIVFFGPADIFRLDRASANLEVLGFALALSIGTGVVFGILPALFGSRSNPSASLRNSTRSSAGISRARLRSALVVAEIALALVLLVDAGLLVRSFHLLRNVPPGFDAEHVLTLRLWLPDTVYDDDASITAAYREILESLSRLPGVEDASAVLGVPLSGTSANFGVVIEGRPAPEPGEELEAGLQPVAPGYFRAMGIPLLLGRDVALSDDKDHRRVAVVSATAAARFFPGEDPVGHRFSNDGEEWIEVVGVVGDVLHVGLDRAPRAEVYVPFQQVVFPFMTVVLKTRGEPALLKTVAEREIQAVASDVPVYRVLPMDDVVSRSIATPRFHTLLLGSFAATALLLAAVGIYGLLGYNVSQRKREIGIRMTLGANDRDILGLFVSEGARLVAMGLGIGLLGAVVVTRAIESLLFGLSASDPTTYLLVSTLLVVVTLVSTYLPARRAAALQPLSVLRQD